MTKRLTDSGYLVQLDLLQAVVPLLLIVHIKDLPECWFDKLTLISFSATRTLSDVFFARKTKENFP
jgi:hypothetical protein